MRAISYVLTVSSLLSASLAFLSVVYVDPVFSHTPPETGVNFIEFNIEGGIDGKKQAYSYINSTNELVYTDRISNYSESKELNKEEIEQLNNIVNSSNILGKQLYDLGHGCLDCQQYRLAYIYTIVNDENESSERFSGVGVWNDESDHENRIIYGNVADVLTDIIPRNLTESAS